MTRSATKGGKPHDFPFQKNPRQASVWRRILELIPWSTMALASSLSYFGMLYYLMEIGLTGPPASRLGHAFNQFVEFAFLPFAVLGTLINLIALMAEIHRARLFWFLIVFFFAFFFVGHFFALLCVNLP